MRPPLMAVKVSLSIAYTPIYALANYITLLFHAFVVDNMLW